MPDPESAGLPSRDAELWQRHAHALDRIKARRQVEGVFLAELSRDFERLARQYRDVLASLRIPGDAGEYFERLVAVLLRFADDSVREVRCDRGWYPLITRLDRQLAEVDPDYFLYEVGQRSGALHVCCEATRPDLARTFADLVSQAQADSRVTCEVCGCEAAPATDLAGDFIKTLCDVCMCDLMEVEGVVLVRCGSIGGSTRGPEVAG